MHINTFIGLKNKLNGLLLYNKEVLNSDVSTPLLAFP